MWTVLYKRCSWTYIDDNSPVVSRYPAGLFPHTDTHPVSISGIDQLSTVSASKRHRSGRAMPVGHRYDPYRPGQAVVLARHSVFWRWAGLCRYLRFQEFTKLTASLRCVDLHRQRRIIDQSINQSINLFDQHVYRTRYESCRLSKPKLH